ARLRCEAGGPAYRGLLASGWTLRLQRPRSDPRPDPRLRGRHMRQSSVRATRREFVAAVGAVAATPLAQTLQSVMAEPDLAKAMNALRAAIPVAAADPERPTYHFHPPANWNNDPNGTFFYKGEHPIFYQPNPFAPTGAND